MKEASKYPYRKMILVEGKNNNSKIRADNSSNLLKLDICKIKILSAYGYTR